MSKDLEDRLARAVRAGDRADMLPARTPRSLSREVDRVRDDAWRVLRGHEARCQLCVGSRLCSLGVVLRGNWVAVIDLAQQPSLWATVEED